MKFIFFGGVYVEKNTAQTGKCASGASACTSLYDPTKWFHFVGIGEKENEWQKRRKPKQTVPKRTTQM